MRAPTTRRGDAVTELPGGHRAPDPYRALEDAGDPETARWLAAQDAHYAAHRATWGDGLLARVAELTASPTADPPVWAGGHRFRAALRPGGEHPVLLVRPPGEPERVLLDPAASGPDTTLESWHPSPDGRSVAVLISEGGTEQGALRVLDLDGSVVDGPIGRSRGTQLAWLPGAFCYTPLSPRPDGRLAREVRLHRLGEPEERDVTVLAEDGCTSFALETDGHTLVVVASRGPSAPKDVWTGRVTEGGVTELRPVLRAAGSRVQARPTPDGVLVLTDDAAPRARIARLTPGGQLIDLVAEDDEAVLRSFLPLPAAEPGAEPELLVVRNRGLVTEVAAHRLADGRPTGLVALPGAGVVTSLTAHGATAFLGYTDPTTPHTTLRRAPGGTEAAEWSAEPPPPAVPRRAPAKAGAPPRSIGDARTATVPCRAPDGAEIPVLALWTGPRPTGPRPLLLQCYGGFGVVNGPTYSPEALAWVEAGGVHVRVGVRGGGERGARWHRAGNRATRARGAQDLIAAARALIDLGWTTPARLGLLGASHGGLVVAAALTAEPRLFGAAVCLAPLADMLRCERLGAGSLWRAEYGSAEDPEQAAWLVACSPYHAVRPGAGYPPVLLAVFDGDSRVHPAHAHKLCAALQHASHHGATFLRRESGVGHGRRSVGRAAGLAADQLAFFSTVLNGPNPPGPARSGTTPAAARERSGA
ncbi:prolyl oligopeptidase family serine peptidase [Actinosynnema mirum]|uniref:prolyl oligopeptidase n=1 Tax=Actinosynnema mirum (strain ATCC 29888 / DSM 43827 / JCM 3225 / NBRC 14064 / NCIMB 13271 / NRRL B-12336 / IMRU 3971 / 101) TaxID=446462 RepID=C6WPG7_ACTMD|nr:prolyl oligopeptidase family serine peptidase [Actinosynnema mirum]ACU38669.1 peptidase S9 prolyl oligopeptidase active site domain protein [Actinosynnema mirum DSM 43827]